MREHSSAYVTDRATIPKDKRTGKPSAAETPSKIQQMMLDRTLGEVDRNIR